MFSGRLRLAHSPVQQWRCHGLTIARFASSKSSSQSPSSPSEKPESSSKSEPSSKLSSKSPSKHASQSPSEPTSESSPSSSSSASPSSHSSSGPSPRLLSRRQSRSRPSHSLPRSSPRSSRRSQSRSPSSSKQPLSLFQLLFRETMADELRARRSRQPPSPEPSPRPSRALRSRSPPSDTKARSSSLLLGDELRSWFEITTPSPKRPSDKDQGPAVLVVSCASRSLAESDFYRLAPQGRHVDGWAGGITKGSPSPVPSPHVARDRRLTSQTQSSKPSPPSR